MSHSQSLIGWCMMILKERSLVTAEDDGFRRMSAAMMELAFADLRKHGVCEALDSFHWLTDEGSNVLLFCEWVGIDREGLERQVLKVLRERLGTDDIRRGFIYELEVASKKRQIISPKKKSNQDAKTPPRPRDPRGKFTTEALKAQRWLARMVPKDA